MTLIISGDDQLKPHARRWQRCLLEHSCVRGQKEDVHLATLSCLKFCPLLLPQQMERPVSNFYSSGIISNPLCRAPRGTRRGFPERCSEFLLNKPLSHWQVLPPVKATQISNPCPQNCPRPSSKWS